jgi:hypothetical protein
MVESGILFNLLFLTTDVKFILSGYLRSKNQVGIENFPALKFKIGIVSFKPIFMIHAVVLLQIEIDFNFQNVSCAPNFLFFSSFGNHG